MSSHDFNQLRNHFNDFSFSFPSDVAGGYLCFIVSILCIGVVTAIIGDVASHFGCTLGIKDSVTAIVFVALGTSIPGEPDVETDCGHDFNLIVLSQIRSPVR